MKVKKVAVTPARTKRFYIDGAGADPNGLNSGYAFVYVGRDIQRVRRNDGMTNNQAEYSGLIAVLKYVAAESEVLIFTDSELVCKQFCGQYAVRDRKLKELLETARQLVKEKELYVEVHWILREANLAGRLLDRG
jgi:ribonuclease HI